MTNPKDQRIRIGWREWIELPELGIHSIKAKIDTGARTSSLHAFQVETFRRSGRDFARFRVHPFQRDSIRVVQAEAPLIDVRTIRSSSGHITERPVITTQIRLFDEFWTIELTLANRDQMGFRMLLGREAIRGRFLVDPGNSFCDSNSIPKRGTRR